VGAWFREGDLEGLVGDGAGLADELVYPLLGKGAVAVVVDIGFVGVAGWLSVDEDAVSDRGAWFWRSHDEVEVAGVEAAGDLPVRRVQRGGLFLHGPVPGQGPVVEPQPLGDGVGVRLAGHTAAGEAEFSVRS
jgi:hypothetical protein